MYCETHFIYSKFPWEDSDRSRALKNFFCHIRRFQPFPRVPFHCRGAFPCRLPLDSCLFLLWQVPLTCQIHQNSRKNSCQVSQKSSNKSVLPSAPATSRGLCAAGGSFAADCSQTANCPCSVRHPWPATFSRNVEKTSAECPKNRLKSKCPQVPQRC